MRQIYKWNLEVCSEQTIEVPSVDFRILDIQLQGGGLVLWAECYPPSKKRTRCIQMAGTGQDVPSGVYIATVQTGPFVWHFYDGGWE